MSDRTLPAVSPLDRLTALPNKVAVPFRHLVANGHLDEATLSTVLDAGELAGDHQHLLGFSTALQYLERTGVPVTDTVTMARKQGRRLNLAWSPLRWKEEHDRLSRAETLLILAQENVTYDLSKFDELIPEAMTATLVRTSKRLGLEGLRQRHCVASYHTAISRGYFALASVIVERRRWTVQLGVRLAEGAQVLSVLQVRTRFNAVCDRSTEEFIRKRFGAAFDPAVEYAREARVQVPRTYSDNLRRVLPVLMEIGASMVTVDFSGSGDTGSIEGVEFGCPEVAERARETVVAMRVVENMHGDDGWTRSLVDKEVDLHDAIIALTDDWLEETDVDWYNDDGGFGCLVIDVDEGTAELDVSARITESNCEYSNRCDIVSGESVD